MKQTLTVLDYNLWHGLNPTGPLKFGEFESAQQREQRLQGFLAQARALRPDVIFLQEVNPAPGLSGRIGRELGLDHVSQIDNAGIKLGSLGLPVNLRSGLTILARPELGLRKLDGCKLSGPPGLCSRGLALQYHEFRYALLAEVSIDGRRVLLINTHLHHGMEITAEVRRELDRLVDQGELGRREADQAMDQAGQGTVRRRGELERALQCAARAGLDQRSAVLFAGDFNATPGAPELGWLIDGLGFRSTTADSDSRDPLYTWDPQRNPNTLYTADFVPPSAAEGLIFRKLGDLLIHERRRLDYVFYRGFEGWLSLRESGLFGEEPYQGLMCSDHFGVYAVFERAAGD